MDWWVITFAIWLVMPIPVVPVRPMVAIQVPVVPVSVAVAVTVAATGSTASHRVFATRSGTVLRYREGTSTRQQYCHHHDAFEDGHVVSPTRRRTHPTFKRNADGTWAVPRSERSPKLVKGNPVHQRTRVAAANRGQRAPGDRPGGGAAGRGQAIRRGGRLGGRKRENAKIPAISPTEPPKDGVIGRRSCG
jgi:hypothetical protein